MNPLLVGNWKMHKTVAESVIYLEASKDDLNSLDQVEVVLCPPFTSLSAMADLLQDSKVKLGAQSVAAWKEGSYTGEVSAEMVAPYCQYAIVGHSERRKMGETNEQVNLKIEQCLAAGLSPIICASNEAEVAALLALKEKASDWIVAFEPLEAIGTGKAEDPETVKKMIVTIKDHLGSETRVLYGGSVTADNAHDYVSLCDGALIGGASLDPVGFLALCKQINQH